jgi:energy-coupling factor transport system permease protein
MGIILLLSLLLFSVTMLAPDGINVPRQPRLPENEWAIATPTLVPTAQDTTIEPTTNLATSPQDLPQPTNYRYVLFERGIIRITRRSLELAIRLGSLIFTLIYSSNLYLMTTAPEEITAGLDDLLAPLRRFDLPITEIVLTLTLSLRFIPLVLEEVQNLVRSVRTRAINWKKLGFRGTAQVWSMIAERLIDNLLVRAEQIASAMQVRGFTSPKEHQVQWHQLRLRLRDWIALAGIGVFWTARFWVGG